jgi:hypothetical protein
MGDELDAELRANLLANDFDEDAPDLRIDDVGIETGSRGLTVRVGFSERDQRGELERPFDEIDLQMLTESTPARTAAAIATWVRNELLEYVSELTAARRWTPGSPQGSGEV